MRFFIALAMLASCTFGAYPVDVIGPGIYCQPLTDYKQRCWDRNQQPWMCDIRGMGWECHREVR